MSMVLLRETGIAPDRIIGTQTGKNPVMGHLAPKGDSQSGASFTRPQCVYPKLAAYDGKGDQEDAKSYVCR